MKSEKVKWSILICTIGQRNDRFVKLLTNIQSQVKEFKGEIEIVAYWNNGEKPLWQIRDSLIYEAQGRYISFIDDDDDVPAYYCSEVIKALKTSPDYVGWRMQAWQNGEKLKPTFHSLTYEGWHEDDCNFYRNVSHLNPIKRKIALSESFEVENNTAEDEQWAKRIFPKLKTEAYIDKEMYWYLHTTQDSVWRGDIMKFNKYTRPVIRKRYFRWHPDSKKVYIPGEN